MSRRMEPGHQGRRLREGRIAKKQNEPKRRVQGLEVMVVIT